MHTFSENFGHPLSLLPATTEEQQELMRNIGYTYTDSNLPGMRVFHGTDRTHIASILEGPKDFRVGLGGSGLNVSPEYTLAHAFASTNALRSYQNPVVMVGDFNPYPTREYRVTKIATKGFSTKINAKTGIFPCNWSKYTDVVQFVKSNSDIVHCLHQGSFMPSDFFVIGQKAGSQVVQWKGYIPIFNVHNAGRFRLNPGGTLPATIRPHFSNPGFLSPRLFQACYQSSAGLTPGFRISVASMDMVSFKPDWVPYYKTTLQNPPITESHTIPWRSGFSEPRRVPFYKAIDYRGLSKIVLHMLKPLILPCYAVYDTMKEVNAHPNQSIGATSLVVTSRVTMDLVAIAGLIKAGFSNTPAGLTVASANLLSHLADNVRAVPAESMRNNRDLFMASIFDSDLSPEHEMWMIQAFDEGQTWTRDYNENTALAVQTALYPFALLHDAQTMVSKTARSAGDFLTKQVEKILPDKIDETPVKHTLPVMNKSLLNYPKGMSLITHTQNNLSFHIPKNSELLSPELHEFLSNAPPENMEVPENTTISSPKLEKLHAHLKTSGAVLDNTETPLVSHIALKTVKNGVGIDAVLASGGTISVAANLSGFEVSVTLTGVGELLSSPLGAAIGVGALIAIGALVAQHFHTQHLKRIQHKVNKSLKHTNQESQEISDALSKLSTKVNQPEESSGTNCIDLIALLTKNISNKIKKEQDRGEYARSHHNHRAGDVHFGALRTYEKHMENLYALKNTLHLNADQKTFIAVNQDKTHLELIQLANELTSKPSLSAKDISEIEGLRYLIVNKLFRLTASDNLADAQHLITETHALTYYLPGTIKELTFGDGFGKLAKNITDDLKKIKKAAENINTCIALGKDPLDLLETLARDISETYLLRWENEKSHRRHIKHKSDSYVSLEQWDARIHELTDFFDLLTNQITLFKNGNNPADFRLENLDKLFQQLSANTDRSAAFWLSSIQAIQMIPPSQRTETDTFHLSLAIQCTLNAAFSEAVFGHFDDASHILAELGSKVSEHQLLTNTLLAKIEELKPYYHDVHQCLAKLKTSTAENQNMDDALGRAILKQVIQNDIIAHIIKEDFVVAQSTCDAFAENAPEESALIAAYRAGITELKLLDTHNNENLIKHYSETISSTDSESSIKNMIKTSVLNTWIIHNLFKKVCADKQEEALHDLNAMMQKDNRQQALYEQLKQKILHGETNKNQQAAFWLIEYKKALLIEKQNNKADQNASIVNNMDIIIAFKAISSCAQTRSLLGFHGEAAAILKQKQTIDTDLRLDEAISDHDFLDHEQLAILKHSQTIDADLRLNEAISDYEFLHHGQLLNIYTKPLQDLLARWVRRWQPSVVRSLILGNLNFINTVEIFVPNIIPLAIQAAYAYRIGSDMSVVYRALEKTGAQLSMELNPFDPFYNPLNSVQGITIYGHLLLKAIQLAPLEWIVPSEKLSSVKNIQNHLLFYGNLSMRTVSIVNACAQLKYAKSLGGSIFASAYTPTHLTTLFSAGIDLGYYGYEYYKNSRGEAIEDPEHYAFKEGIGYGMTTISMLAMSSLLSNGLVLLPLAAGFAYGTNSLDALRSEETRQECIAKALIAAMSNMQYYRQLQAKDEYIRSCRIHVINHALHDEDVHKIKSGADIFVRRFYGSHGTGRTQQIGVKYYVYFLDIEKNSLTKEECYFPCKIDWKNAKNTLLLSGELAKQAMFFVKKAILSTPIMDNYTGSCDYSVIHGYPDSARLKQIKSGKEICFSKDNASTFVLYIKDNRGGFTEITIPDNLDYIFSDNKNNTHYTSWHQKNYTDLSGLATPAVIRQALRSSLTNIEYLLTTGFRGLAYNKHDPEVANIARITHFHQLVSTYDTSSAISWTNAWKHEQTIIIHRNLYQLPPHLVWQTLLSVRLLAYAQTEALLLDFSNQYKEYVGYIYHSARQSKTWYADNCKNIQNSLKQILNCAWEHLILAADKASTPEKKRAFLSQFDTDWSVFDDWKYEINDELTFWIAYLYHSLEDQDKCMQFLNNIKDLIELIRNKKQANFTEAALAMLADIDIVQHQKLTIECQNGSVEVSDTVLFNAAFQYISHSKFAEADQFLAQTRPFEGIKTIRAYLTFESSSRKEVLLTLKQLMQEKEASRGLIFWHILYDLLKICLLKTHTDQINNTFNLFILLNACAHKIQTYTIPPILQSETDQMIEKALSYVKKHIIQCQPKHGFFSVSEKQVNDKVKEHMELGHTCIHHNIYNKIESMFSSVPEQHAIENDTRSLSFVPR